MPVNGQDVKFNYYTRAKFNALSSKDANTIYYVEETNGKVSMFVGSKEIGTVTQTALDLKVDKVSGKGLSTNDFTKDLKSKLDGIQTGAQVNTVLSVAGKTGSVLLNKGDVGLENVDNTADLAKPISTATQTALNLKADKAQLSDYVTVTAFDMQMLEKLGIKPNGTDLLIINGMINPLYIDDTSYKSNHLTVNNQAAMLALDVPPGTVVVRLDTPSKELFLLTKLPASTLSNWQVVSSNTVVSVAGKTGVIVLGISDIDGLTNALNLKLDVVTFVNEVSRLEGLINNKVNKYEMLDTGTNLGNVLESGFYRILSSAADAPYDSDYGQMIVSKGADTIGQIYLTYYTNKMYYRGGTTDGIKGKAWNTLATEPYVNSMLDSNLSQVYGGKNLARPDLSGKEYLGNGEYRLLNQNGLIINYNVNTGYYYHKGTLTGTFTKFLTLPINFISGTPYTFQVWKKPNTILNRVYPFISSAAVFSVDLENNDYGVSTHTFDTTSDFSISQYYYTDLTVEGYFKVQIEKGTTATPYTLPMVTTWDNIASKPTFKTINGQQITGEGDIVIPKGDKGDKGDIGGFQPFARKSTMVVNVPNAMQRDIIILYLDDGSNNPVIYLFPKATGAASLKQNFTSINYMNQVKNVEITISSNGDITTDQFGFHYYGARATEL